jgi:hypothetical protein
MSVPLSDTARAIRTLDARYGKDGWRVQRVYPFDWAVWVHGGGPLNREDCSTAREAICAAVEELRAKDAKRQQQEARRWDRCTAPPLPFLPF